VLSFPLADRTVLRGYAEFADLPENRSILVYSLDEIAAEKTLALTDPARNEPRDLYDLWYLTTNEELQLDHLLPAICQKLEFREKPCEDLQAALAQKEARLRALWNTRLSYQMPARLTRQVQAFDAGANSNTNHFGIIPIVPSHVSTN
jgi:predicted nucleotidyltransferase component of viral defense system